MAARKNQSEAISGVGASGFKSLAEPTEIDILPLTILAGANSSGKSTIMQPILLLKQTLESPTDPGPLLLDGDNVPFSRADQMLSTKGARQFSFNMTMGGHSLELVFESGASSSPGLSLIRQTVDRETLTPDLSVDQAVATLTRDALHPVELLFHSKELNLRVARERCFLRIQASRAETPVEFRVSTPITDLFADAVSRVIHVPGLRGAPERNYPLRAVRDRFPGRFEAYSASIILQWMREDKEKAAELNRWMEVLGLTWKIQARQLDDTRVELQVGRTPKARRGGTKDLVSIADVGFGVSQVLPALVALLAAGPGQLVYLEQPEIHLHPRAQHQLASLLVEASRRGVQLVVETHSSILLMGVQTLVAQGKADPDSIRLHWFQRDEQGWTQVSSRSLDDTGAFGDWPSDFDAVELSAQSAYLDALEARQG